MVLTVVMAPYQTSQTCGSQKDLNCETKGCRNPAISTTELKNTTKQALNKCAQHSIAFFIWGFPKITGTLLLLYWGLYWGSTILGNYHLKLWVSERPGRCYAHRIDFCGSAGKLGIKISLSSRHIPGVRLGEHQNFKAAPMPD